MENLIEKVKEFIKRELENCPTNPEHSFKEGYRTALIDVRDYIINNRIIKIYEKEKDLIGKWGFFWDKKGSNVFYGKLLKIYFEDEKIKYYETINNFSYTFFSLTIPEHCKDN